MGRDIGCQGLCGLKRLTITGEDIPDLALRNSHKWDTQDIRLKARLAFECNKPGFHRPTTAHELLHNANAVVGYVAEKPRDEDEEQQNAEDDQHECK